MTAPDIISVMQKLFASTFDRGRGRDSWAAWRSFLKVVFALPLDAEALAAYDKHCARTDPPEEQFREVLAIVGRRGGKSVIAALVAVFVSCFRDYSAVLAPGETGVVLLLAADRLQARVIFGYVAGFFKTIPQLRKMVKAQLKESIELKNRIRISVHTSSYKSLRGYTVVAAVCDELAFWPNDTSSNPDSEIVAALRPAMATIPNSLLLGISSPYAKRGVLFDGYQRYFGKPKSPVLVWVGDTKSMNSTVSQREIERAYEQDPASARAEYGAQFRDDIASFVDREKVEACVVRNRGELLRASDVTYHGFVDPSGGSSDSMVLAIAHKHDGKAVLDLVREIVPPFSPEGVTAEFSDVLKSYGIHRVIGDAYGGDWPREQFRKRGIEYQLANKNRSELYLSLLPLINSGSCELLDLPKLILQLAGLERRTASSGKDSIDHRPGSHDDLANAVAGVLVEVIGREIHMAVIELKLEELNKIEAARVVSPESLSCSACGRACVLRGPVKRCSACGKEERIDLDDQEHPRPRAEIAHGSLR